MAVLERASRAWNTPAFASVLEQEMQQLDRTFLPLQQGTTQGGYVGDGDLGVMTIRSTQEHNTIRAKVGVFFTEIVINCGCGDDPYESSAYCEMEVLIDRATGEAAFTIVDSDGD